MNKKQVLSGFLFIGLTIIFSAFYPQENQEAQEIKKAKIIFREIGNQLLLSTNDSISLILPVKKIDEHTYQISFQKEFSFQPDSLVNIIRSNLSKTNFPKNYIVEVLKCLKNEVTYSFEINENEAQTLVPCSSRIVPKNCYLIEIQFMELKTSNNNLLFYVLIPLILIFVYWKSYQKKKQNYLEIKNSNSNNKTLGSFMFYPEQNKLVKQAKEIALSKKECELLAIFISKKNQVVKREELTKKVWEDNGVFVGRSLDTYVSKLRKKLKEDTSIKLINIHGIGYKLEIKG